MGVGSSDRGLCSDFSSLGHAFFQTMAENWQYSTNMVSTQHQKAWLENITDCYLTRKVLALEGKKGR